MSKDKTPFNEQGQKHGYWEEYYYENPRYKGNYVNGIVHGHWEEYWKNGNLCYKVNHTNGWRQGYCEFYNYDDNSITRKVFDLI